MNPESNIRLQAIVAAAGAALMLLKFVAYSYTGSHAILADAVESIANVVAGSFALFSLTYAARPKDKDHPYGHGKIEFLSAAFEGLLILLAAVWGIVETLRAVVHPPELQHLDAGMLLMFLAAALNYVMGRSLVRRGTEAHSMAMVAEGRHLQADTYATLSLLAGVAAVFLTGLVWLDAVIALIFWVVIIVTGTRLLLRSIDGIMDRADYPLAGTVVERINAARQPNWIDIHNFRIIQYGAALHVDCHLTLPYYFTVVEAHGVVKELEETVRVQNPETVVELFIHTDPCIPPLSCRVCTKTDCTVRVANFERRVEWEFDTVFQNAKHGVGL